MFKSVFRKYLAAFSVIICISFGVIVVLLYSGLDNYAYDIRGNILEDTADSAVRAVNSYMSLMNRDLEYLLTNETEQMQSNVDVWAESSESVVFLTDTDGNILLSSSNYISDGRPVPDGVIASLSSGKNEYKVSTLAGFFEDKHLCSMKIIRSADDSADIAALFVCASDEQTGELLNSLAGTLLLAISAVFLFVLLSVFFISRKITEPLKKISEAARAFAHGNFEMRVPVKGSDEVASLAVAFNNMADSLERLEDTRRMFIANVSHDLRSPMTSIAGFIDGILDGAVKPEDREHYLTIVKSEINRLSRLVSSLLDISQIEAGERRFTKRPFDICEMARQILISCEARIEQKNIGIEFDCDQDNMWVYSDEDAIHQVTYNIVDNAVKFANNGSSLSIGIHRSEKDKKVLVSIRNTGEGIASADLPYVFERFYKSDRSRGLDKSGAGLGLFIVKTILESLGETIQAESKEHEYCEFLFTLTESRSGKSGRKKPQNRAKKQAS